MECDTAPDLMKDDENDLFYFESDHLAIKGNKDYCEVLKTLVILSAIRERAVKDYSKVVEVRKKCLADPIGTLEKIQNGEDIGVPAPLDLPKLPVINFDKFNIKVLDMDIKNIYTDGVEKTDDEKIKDKGANKKEGTWTTEEQKKLEELLIIYPPEPIEMKRFQKIAAALGNRSVQQVTSRVQKYFIKLYKAGLPIPGRIPKSVEKYKRTNLHRNQRYNQQHLWKPSTFFPDLYVPVTMDENESVPGPSVIPPSNATTSASTSQNYLLPTDYQMSGIEKSINLPKNDLDSQLQLLKRVKAEKIKEQDNENVGMFRHFGYRCDYCDSDPITGSRWHCMTCSSDSSVDFCTDCLLSQMYSSDSHPPSHIYGVFRGNGENPSLICSDSDTQTEASGAYKNYESDSNWSGDFDNGSNVGDFNAEHLNSDSNMDLENGASDNEN